MMADNRLLPFAMMDTGANLLSQEEYETDSERFTGNQPGIARSMLVNKALRQSSLVAAAVGEFMARHADAADPDVADTLTVNETADYLQKAVSKIASLGGSGLPEGGEAGQALVIGEDGPEWRHVSGDPVGTIIAFAGKEAPKGFISISTDVETAVPVDAYPDLVKAVYCGDAANEEADFFYRAMNADGSVRHPDGAYLVLPAASKYFLRGRDATGEVDAYRYQGDATKVYMDGSNYIADGGNNDRKYGIAAAANGRDGITVYQSSVQTSLSLAMHSVYGAADETRPMNFPVLWCIKAWDAAVLPSELDVQALVNAWSNGSAGDRAGRAAAWVTFSSSTAGAEIISAHNVAAVTRISTGVYDIYFDEPMASADYAAFVSSPSINPATNRSGNEGTYFPPTVASFRVVNLSVSSTPNDRERISAIVFSRD